MTFRLEIDGALATLFIDRPDKRNAFTMTMWEAMQGLLEQAARNAELRLLVIRSSEPGGAFSAGADIRELLANKDDADWRAANQVAINRVQYMLARHPLPTIAFVEGDCFGGGCGIALACDLRIATNAARFAITPSRLGLVYPLHDVKLLTDLVGPGQAKRILFTGAPIDAKEAQRIGLVEILAEEPDAVVEAVLSASLHSIRETKQFVRRVLDGQTKDDADTLRIFAEAFEGPDFIEGSTAFVEKRKPDFGG